MPTDRTRPSDDLRQGYRGVRFQQGRVVLDRDLNAGEEISAAEFRFVGLDVVGPFGSPDDGYKIIPDTAKKHDFGISSGSIYVGGVRITLPSATTYFTQSDSLTHAKAEPADAKPWNELVYLRVSQVEVSAREDGDLADVGLGASDTAGRVRMLARVERMPTTAADCTGAFAELVSKSKDLGFKFDAPTHLLLPRGKLLKVAFDTTTTAATLCQPEAAGGYLHPDNQCVRIKRTPADELIWGFDNASFLYTIDETLPITTTTTLKILPAPPDASRYPKANQYVELLRAVASLPQGGFLAEPDGFVTKLTSDYDPDTGQVTLTGPVPAAYQEAKHKLFLRVWESKVEADGRLIAVSAPAGPTGLRVELADGEAKFGPAVNSYWVFAPRPMTPQKVYPERFTIQAQIADGPYDWIAPLAFLKWPTTGTLTKADISDCRPHFDNLVELTDREPVATGGGCCTITVTPEDVTKAGRLRELIAKGLGDGKRRVRVCFQPGTYQLVEPLLLDNPHTGIAIEGCIGVTWQAHPNTDPMGFLHGMIVLTNCPDVTIHGITFRPPAVQPLDEFKKRGVPSLVLDPLLKEFSSVRTSVAIRATASPRLTVAGCRFEFPDVANADDFGAGLLAHGNCTGLSVTGCQFAPAATGRRLGPHTKATIAASQANLTAIGRALRVAATRKVAPLQLGDVIATFDQPPAEAATFVNPVGKQPTSANVAWEKLPEWVNQFTNYVYLRPDKPEALTTPHRVLAYEQPTKDSVGVNVLFGDGRALFLTLDLAREAIQASGGKLAAAVARQQLRAWFGILLWRSVRTPANADDPFVLRPVVDQVRIAVNHFAGLTAPVWSVGLAGSVSFHENQAADCTGGFWHMIPDDAENEVKDIPDARLGCLVANAFPLPGKFDAGKPDEIKLDCVFRLTSNDLEARPTNGVQSGWAVALQCDLRFQSELNLATVTGNRLTNFSTGQETLTAEGPYATTVTGNVILNTGLIIIEKEGLPPAMHLKPSGVTVAGNQVAISGNVFRGSVNWNDLKRHPATPHETWQSYNAELT